MIEDRDLNARLENWARVYRDRSCLRASWLAKMIALYGAEGRGIANECEKDCSPVDVKDAARVERALLFSTLSGEVQAYGLRALPPPVSLGRKNWPGDGAKQKKVR